MIRGLCSIHVYFIIAQSLIFNNTRMIKYSTRIPKNRPQESQRLDLNQYLSNEREVAKSRRHGSKDIPPKSPPTPNLEILKQNRMNKQQQPTNKPNHCRHKSPIHLLQQSTADNLKSDENQAGNYFCSNHPDKKSKYFLARDFSFRLCTACAINYAQVETVLDDEKLHKTNDIMSLKEMIKMVKGMIPERDQDINKQIRMEEDMFKHILEVVDNQFEMIFRSVQQKHNELVDYVHNKHREYIIHLESEKGLIPVVTNALEKYTFDIDRNYEEIINELSITQFDSIMKQYRAKISDYSDKLNKDFQDLIDINIIKNQITDITSRVKNLSLDKGRSFANGLLKPMLKRGENRNCTNILMAVTPDRIDRFY